VRKKDERYPFMPVFREKYAGTVPIFFRSKWERDYALTIDHNPSVIQWSYESKAIRYYDPITNRLRIYLPDFEIKYDTGKWCLIEFKPRIETRPPKKRKGKKTTTLLRQQRVWERNKAKWEAAQKFCERTGMEFQILTEYDVLQRYKTKKIKRKLRRKK
jgi:hypothetical protein